MNDLQQEFKLLSERAKQQLRDIAASGSYRHVFSLLTMPAFSPSSQCTVYAPRKSPLASVRTLQPFATFSIWRSDLDWKKFKSPVERLKYPRELVPTIQHDTLLLTDSEIEKMEQQISGIAIPIFLGKNAVLGTDGTSFEFLYDGLFIRVSLKWWVNYPVEWRPFTEPIMRIVAELDERRKRNSAENCE